MWAANFCEVGDLGGFQQLCQLRGRFHSKVLQGVGWRENALMGTRSRRPPAPPGLLGDGKRLWRDIVGRFDLDPHELLILQQACQIAKVVQRLNAEALLAESGGRWLEWEECSSGGEGAENAEFGPGKAAQPAEVAGWFGPGGGTVNLRSCGRSATA